LTVKDLVNYGKSFKNLKLKEGDYIIGILVKHENITSVASASFKIKGTVLGLEKFDIAKYLLFIGMIAIILTIMIFNLRTIRKIRYARTKSPKKKTDLSKKVRLVKEYYKKGLIKKSKKR